MMRERGGGAEMMIHDDNCKYIQATGETETQ